MGKAVNELLDKMKALNNFEELKKLLRENHMELDKAEKEELWKALQEGRVVVEEELSSDELENIAGGASDGAVEERADRKWFGLAYSQDDQSKIQLRGLWGNR